MVKLALDHCIIIRLPLTKNIIKPNRKTESEDIKRKYKEGVVNSEELPVLSPTEVELFLASA